MLVILFIYTDFPSATQSEEELEPAGAATIPTERLRLNGIVPCPEGFPSSSAFSSSTSSASTFSSFRYPFLSQGCTMLPHQVALTRRAEILENRQDFAPPRLPLPSFRVCYMISRKTTTRATSTRATKFIRNCAIRRYIELLRNSNIKKF